MTDYRASLSVFLFSIFLFFLSTHAYTLSVYTPYDYMHAHIRVFLTIYTFHFMPIIKCIVWICCIYFSVNGIPFRVASAIRWFKHFDFTNWMYKQIHAIVSRSIVCSYWQSVAIVANITKLVTDMLIWYYCLFVFIFIICKSVFRVCCVFMNYCSEWFKWILTTAV